MWNYFSCSTDTGMQGSMKIIGALKLDSVADGRSDVDARALALLRAELAEVVWASAVDVRATYPGARIDGVKIEIKIGPACCVRLIVNYRARVVLIDGVDSLPRTSQRPARGRGAGN